MCSNKAAKKHSNQRDGLILDQNRQFPFKSIVYVHLSVRALKYCSLYKPLSKKCSNVNYNLVHDCILHAEKSSQNIMLKCFLWKLSGKYKKIQFCNWWLHSLEFSTSLYFTSESYHSFKTTYKHIWKKRYNIGPRLVCLGSLIMKNLPPPHIHTVVFPGIYHMAVISHIRTNYYFYVTDCDLCIYSGFNISEP